ncbi:MAG: hypothetical protein QW764_02865 [Desulfurococcaceae archaeon]
MEEEDVFSPKRIRMVQAGWSVFLWHKLSILSELLDFHNYCDAAKTLRTLKKFLPYDVKIALQKEFQDIERLNELFIKIDEAVLNKSQKTPFQMSLSIYRSRVLKNRLAEPIVCEVVEKLTSVLDSKGYLELRSLVPTKTGSIEKIGERFK